MKNKLFFLAAVLCWQHSLIVGLPLEKEVENLGRCTAACDHSTVSQPHTAAFETPNLAHEANREQVPLVGHTPQDKPAQSFQELPKTESNSVHSGQGHEHPALAESLPAASENPHLVHKASSEEVHPVGYSTKDQPAHSFEDLANSEPSGVHSEHTHEHPTLSESRPTASENPNRVHKASSEEAHPVGYQTEEPPAHSFGNLPKPESDSLHNGQHDSKKVTWKSQVTSHSWDDSAKTNPKKSLETKQKKGFAQKYIRKPFKKYIRKPFKKYVSKPVVHWYKDSPSFLARFFRAIRNYFRTDKIKADPKSKDPTAQLTPPQKLVKWFKQKFASKEDAKKHSKSD